MARDAKWHNFLHADSVFGEYEFVQPCIDRPGETQVGVGVGFIGDREIPEPLSHRYEMSAISFDRQDGCPGETPAADYNSYPTLFNGAYVWGGKPPAGFVSDGANASRSLLFSCSRSCIRCSKGARAS